MFGFNKWFKNSNEWKSMGTHTPDYSDEQFKCAFVASMKQCALFRCVKQTNEQQQQQQQQQYDIQRYIFLLAHIYFIDWFVPCLAANTRILSNILISYAKETRERDECKT